ncbi:MAG: hypothetical protein DRR19_11815 [Candidatus Parabeggiatoa sp. nov. 1]|nr:MAG: hypothetical protein DRR19_11815 [Gammaproteobacteria bacterium]
MDFELVVGVISKHFGESYFMSKSFYVCLLLSVFLAISGCDDSDDNAHAELVTIGLIFPLSAPKGKPRHQAALLAARHLAEAGYPIRTVVEDSQLDKFLGVDAARNLVENGKAKVLIGASDSGITMEIADWVSIPNQIPQISYASTSPEMTELKDDDFLFRTVPSDKLQGAVLAYLAKEVKGYEKVAVIYRQGSYGDHHSFEFQNEFQSRGGTVTSIQAHVADPPTDFDIEADFTHILDNIRDVGIPQAIVAISRDEESNVYIKQALARKEFKEVEFIFVDANKNTNIFKDVSNTALEGMCGTFPSPPDYKLPPEEDSRLMFENSYNNVFPKDKQQEQGDLETYTFLHHSYDAVIVAGLAAYAATQEKGQAITSIDIRDQLRNVAATQEGTKIGPGIDNLRTALEHLKNREPINYEGASGSVDFDNNGDVIAPIEIWCYNNGQTQTSNICEVMDIGTEPKQVVCKEPTQKPSQ